MAFPRRRKMPRTLVSLPDATLGWPDAGPRAACFALAHAYCLVCNAPDATAYPARPPAVSVLQKAGDVFQLLPPTWEEELVRRGWPPGT
eukprot:364570-Chlamydomonas_euryale.AAC.5